MSHTIYLVPHRHHTPLSITCNALSYTPFSPPMPIPPDKRKLAGEAYRPLVFSVRQCKPALFPCLDRLCDIVSPFTR